MLLIDKAGEQIIQISMVTQVHFTGFEPSYVNMQAANHVKHVLTVRTDRAAGRLFHSPHTEFHVISDSLSYRIPLE